MPTLSASSAVIAPLARPRMPSVPKYLRAMIPLTLPELAPLVARPDTMPRIAAKGSNVFDRYRPPSGPLTALPPRARQKENVPRLDRGAPAGIFAQRRDGGKRRDLLAMLDDEGVIAEIIADRGGVGARIFVGAGQEFEQKRRPVAGDGFARAVEHLALAALNIGLDETNVGEAEAVERAHVDLIGFHVTKLAV